MLQKKYYKLIRVSYADLDLFRITNVSDQMGTLTITGGTTSFTLKYSLNGVDFTNYDFDTHPTITVPAGANLYMKGVKGYPTNPSYYLKFSMDVNHTIGGNIMSIADETNYATMTSIANYGFSNMFYNDSHLISAVDLNFGNVNSCGDNCFNGMFYGCSSLTTVPDLSNITTVGTSAMSSMFGHCTSLTTGPDLSNMTGVGSSAMTYILNGCTSLTTAYAPNVSTWPYTDNWLAGVAATGTLYCPSQAVADLIPDNSASGCPSGWTKVVM